MTKLIALTAAILLLAGGATFARDHSVTYSTGSRHCDILDGVDMEIDRHTIVLTNDDHPDDLVKITRDYKVYVNDKQVKLDSDQEKLVRRFYDQTFDIIDYATELGLEGAKIGVQGAGVAVEALVGVVKLISPNYDSDDLEADVDRAAAKIEARADKLEEKAERIEDMADDLEDAFDTMMDRIPELRRLDWSYQLTDRR